MPVYEHNNNYPFAALVTNLGKYNEGELVGEWVEFPTTAEKMKKVFDRIGIGQADDFGHPYKEWFIKDYDCYVDGLADKLGEYKSLDELNYLASKLDEMSQGEYERFQAAMEIGGHSDSVQEIINLTENLDCYDVYPDIHDYGDLGFFLLGVMQVPEHLKDYIDYEAYGRDTAINDRGRFTGVGYVLDTGSRFVEVYDGDTRNIPEKYQVMAFLDEQELAPGTAEPVSISLMEVKTNMGWIPIEDFREIMAMQYGFDSYDDMYSHGYRLGDGYDGYDKEPEPAVSEDSFCNGESVRQTQEEYELEP